MNGLNLTNYKLLERYGMTEIGMAISNPYIESNDFKRTAGGVGRPCFNCKVRIADQNDNILIESDQTIRTILTYLSKSKICVLKNDY